MSQLRECGKWYDRLNSISSLPITVLFPAKSVCRYPVYCFQNYSWKSSEDFLCVPSVHETPIDHLDNLLGESKHPDILFTLPTVKNTSHQLPFVGVEVVGSSGTQYTALFVVLHRSEADQIDS